MALTADLSCGNLGQVHRIDNRISARGQIRPAGQPSRRRQSLVIDMSRRWSMAIEAAWRQNDLEVIDFGDPLGEFGASGEVKTTSLSLNGVYQFRPERAIRPYLRAGFGLARISFEATTLGERYLDDEDDAPAFQLIGGANIALTERLDFVAELRTWYAHDIEVVRPDGRPDTTWHWVHSAQLGLRYAL